MMSFASGSPNSDFTSASAVRSFFSISRECGLSAKRISDASISSCLFLACRAKLFEAYASLFSAGWKNIRLFVCEAAEKSRPYLASLAASLAVTEIDLTMACNLSTLRP